MIFQLASKVYKQLFEICFNHNYYIDNSIGDLDIEIEPTLESVLLFKNYKLLLKKIKNKIILLQEYDGVDLLPVIDLEDGMKLSFIMLQKNPLLLNFTELPFFKPKKEVLYFSNKSCQLNANSQTLHKAKFVSETDLIPVFTKKNLYKSQKKKVQLSILNSKNEQIFSQNDLTLEKEIEINLEHHASGCYTLLEDKKKVQDFVLLDPIASRTIGYIDLFLDKEQNNYLSKVDSKGLFFKIDFKTRALFWKYSIYKKYNDVVKSQIVDELESIGFTAIEQENEPGIKTFISNQKIEFKERHDHKFKLISKNGSSKFEKILFEKLSYPQISNLEKYKDELVATVFVYA